MKIKPKNFTVELNLEELMMIEIMLGNAFPNEVKDLMREKYNKSIQISKVVTLYQKFNSALERSK